MADINKFYINEEGVKQLATDILNKVNIRMNSKITSTYDSADESNAVTGKAVADAIAALDVAVYEPISNEAIDAAVEAAFADTDTTVTEEPPTGEATTDESGAGEPSIGEPDTNTEPKTEENPTEEPSNGEAVE